MSIIYSIYKITNTKNNKSYVGYTKKHPSKRFEEHCRGNSCYKLPRAIAKYGKECFIVETLYQSKDIQHIRSMENHFILEYDAINSGYNIAQGGQGGCIALYKENPDYEKICAKLSRAQQKNKEFLSKKAKAQHREGNFGEPYKNITDETRQKLSKNRKGKKNSDEHIRKQKESFQKTFNAPGYIHPNKNRIKSSEERKKISENHADVAGEKNPMYGKKHTDKTKQKIREKRTNQQKIECEHCGNFLDKANYARWHGGNCKSKLC